jgi:hypothetical protein
MADVQAWGLDELVELFDSAIIPVRTERIMQQAVEDLLRENEVEYRRESKIARLDRVDFLCGKTGIETKIAGSYIEVASQLLRYAESPAIESLILVTNRANHRQLDRLPNERNIPIRVVFVAFNGF